MKFPLESVIADELESTQSELIQSVQSGSSVSAVLALHQTHGRGRLTRQWYSEAGKSLTVSFAFHAYPNHPKPWLLAIATALAAASVCHSKVAWPNDLIHSGRKVGGVLAEVVKNPQGESVTVVGLGVNLAIAEFPAELATKAGNIDDVSSHVPDVEELARTIVERLCDLPEPTGWKDLKPIWSLFDATAAKEFTLPDGSLATAIGIGPDGELICSVDGETRSVFVADAIFG